MDDLDSANNNVQNARCEDSGRLKYSFHESVPYDSKYAKQDLVVMESSGTSNQDLETSVMSTTSDTADLADHFEDALDVSPNHCSTGDTRNDYFTDASEYPSLSYIIAEANARLTNHPEDSEPLSLWSATIQDSEEFLDDSPSDFNQYVMSVLEYEDPSANYQFVTDPQRFSHLDNSEALLEQLRGMGVSVNRDYLTLDIDFSISGPNSLQDDGSVGDRSVDDNGDCLGPEGLWTAAEPLPQRLQTESESVNKNSASQRGCEIIDDTLSPGSNVVPGDTGALATAGRFLRRLSATKEVPSRNLNSFNEEPLSPLMSLPSHDEEVVEAHFTPDGNIKVIYDNLSKDYRSRVSSHDDHVKYLQLMDLDEQYPMAGRSSSASSIPSATQSHPAIGLRSRLVSGIDGKLRRRLVLIRRPRTPNSTELKEDFKKFVLGVPHTLKELPDRCKHKIQRLLAPEVGVDVSTPDSGVHENMAGLTSEEQELQNKEWEAELAKTEEEIATLRTVLASKVNHAHELKRRLGITVWKELSDDINQSLKTVRESQPYQKTAGAIGAVGEKTSSLFGGIGAKFGQLKETPTFKSFEERVGGVYTAARSKIPGGSGSNSTQDFEEAFKEVEGEKAAAEAAANIPAQDGMGVDPSQQQQPQQQQSLA